MSMRPHIPAEGQSATVLEPHCRLCRYFKAAFHRNGKELFRLTHFRSKARRDEAIRDWKNGATMADIAERYK